MKVLLIEDHSALARVSCDLLRDVHGHDVECAHSGAEALACAARFAPDIVLMDLNLPDINGYDLAVRLRARPELKDAVFVALTGFGHGLSIASATDAGIDAQFRKPMDFALLPTIKRRARPHD